MFTKDRISSSGTTNSGAANTRTGAMPACTRAFLEILPAELKPIYDYFVKFYVGRITHVRPNGVLVRDSPMFPAEV